MFQLNNIKYPPDKFPLDSELFLLSIKDIIDFEASKQPLSKQMNDFLLIKNWVFDYLMRPNAEIGRSGPVCPFVPKAVQENSIYMTIINADAFQKIEFYKKILNYLEWFILLEPASSHKSIFRSIIMVIDIPNINLEETIEHTIEDLKLHFIEKKLMLGEFHSGPPKNGGIRNPHFKPLKSPIPLLVMREMVETDIEFLKTNPIHMAHYKHFFPDKKND